MCDDQAVSASAPLAAGDRVRLFGGYGSPPEWLGGRSAIDGTVERFIPGQNEQGAAVVRLDDELAVKDAKGCWAILELA